MLLLSYVMSSEKKNKNWSSVKWMFFKSSRPNEPTVQGQIKKKVHWFKRFIKIDTCPKLLAGRYCRARLKKKECDFLVASCFQWFITFLLSKVLWHIYRRRLLKTLWQKENLFIMSNFCFCNASSLFYKKTFMYTRILIFYLSVCFSRCCRFIVSGNCAIING